MRIWKHQLNLRDGLQHVSMPAGATVLDVQMQGGTICIWEMHGDRVLGETETEQRSYAVIGTGEYFELPSGSLYVGTVQLDNGEVWHLFEVILNMKLEAEEVKP